MKRAFTGHASGIGILNVEKGGQGRLCGFVKRKGADGGIENYGVSCNHVLTNQTNTFANPSLVNRTEAYPGNFNPVFAGLDQTAIPLKNDVGNARSEADQNTADVAIYELTDLSVALPSATLLPSLAAGQKLTVGARRAVLSTVLETDLYCKFESGIWNSNDSRGEVYFSNYFSLAIESGALAEGDSGSPITVTGDPTKLAGMYCGSGFAQRVLEDGITLADDGKLIAVGTRLLGAFTKLGVALV